MMFVLAPAFWSNFWLAIDCLAIAAVILVIVQRYRNKQSIIPNAPSWFLRSLDPKDRRLLLWSVSIAIGLTIIIGLVMPSENNNDNPMPSTYLTGQHGARAAYESLVRSGYNIERWERPLGELAANAGPGTVVIFAQPFTRETQDFKAVDQIVARGGRVLATGFWGGYLVPEGDPGTPTEFTFAACQLEPEGLDLLAGTGEVWMVPEATWQVGNPAQRIQYELRRAAGSRGIRLRQRPRRVVGEFHAARKRISGACRRLRPSAQLPRTARGPSLLLGRVSAWRCALGMELRYRPSREYALVGRPDSHLDSDRLQLQPSQRPGARDASSGASHAHRIP